MIPELGRFPGEGNGYQVRYSCKHRRAWQVAVRGFAKGQTQLSDYYTFHEVIITQLENVV